MTLFRDFVELFYPSLCISCKQRLFNNEPFLCITCLCNLPKTNHLINSKNKLSYSFHGRLPLEGIAAFGYFTKGNCIQKIIHEIKYKKNKQLGLYIGEMCGEELQNSNFIKQIDCIVPVPLHPKREKKRGYNQSSLIALGISKKTGIPVIEKNLIKTINNTTQTLKSRSERWHTTNDMFAIRDNTIFESKHILLIDDIITTGSTIEVCAKRILSCTGSKISIYCFGLTI